MRGSDSSSSDSQSLDETYGSSGSRPRNHSGPSVSGGIDFTSVAVAVLLSLLVTAAFAGVLVTNLDLSDDPSISTTVSADDPPVVSNGTSVSESYSDLYNATLPSTVSVYAMNDSGRSSQGSGFVYDKQGRIVTNHHVVKNGDSFYVRYMNGEWTSARVIGMDPYTDLAVLVPNKSPEYADPLPLSESVPNEGDKVFVIGSPTGLQGSITAGIVSGVERSMSTRSGFAIPDMIQTDAALNPGNSGGPLVNSNGVVVGVNRARKGENIGFAISSRLTDKIAQSLIDDGEHEHPMIGIRTVGITPRIAEANNITLARGVLVTEVISGTPASGHLKGAGGETVTKNGQELPLGGDVIVALDGHPINNNEELASYLMLHKSPGEEMTATVIRDGERTNVTFTLGKRPPFNKAP